MSKLDKSWEKFAIDQGLKNWDRRAFLEGIEEFQDEALKALEKEYKRLDKIAEPAYPSYYDERNGIGKAIAIIKELKK